VTDTFLLHDPRRKGILPTESSALGLSLLTIHPGSSDHEIELNQDGFFTNHPLILERSHPKSKKAEFLPPFFAMLLAFKSSTLPLLDF